MNYKYINNLKIFINKFEKKESILIKSSIPRSNINKNKKSILVRSSMPRFKQYKPKTLIKK